MKNLFGSDYKALIAGTQLTLDAANTLRASKCLRRSDKFRLLSYLNQQGDVCRNERLQLLQQLIESAPSSTAWRHLDLVYSQADLKREIRSDIVDTWLKLVGSADPNIVGNAGLAIVDFNFELGISLLVRAASADAQDDFWAEQIVLKQFFHVLNPGSTHREESAQAILRYGEQFLELYGNEGGRRNSKTRLTIIEICLIAAYLLGGEKLDKFVALELETTKSWKTKPKTTTSVCGLHAFHKADIKLAVASLLKLSDLEHPDEWDLELARLIQASGEIQIAQQYFEDAAKVGHWTNLTPAEWLNFLATSRPDFVRYPIALSGSSNE